MKGIFVRIAMGLAALLFSGVAAAASTVTYYYNDLAGSPVVATNATGQVIWRESYQPYGGRTRNEAAATENKVWFTSRRQDAETGLVYMGARYYDPLVGRFVSTDPVGFDEKNLHSFNRYAYAHNNPYSYRDPDGRSPLPNQAPATVDQKRDHALFVERTMDVFRGAAEAASAVFDAWTNASLLALGGVGAEVQAARAATLGIQEGATLFRVFGGEARGLGQSWTTVSPGAVSNFREAAGLFPGNTGQFVIEGRLINTEGVLLREALKGPGGVGGGLPEAVVPNAAQKICIVCVSGANPAF